MNLIEEIKGTIKIEIRPNSRGTEYLEAVIEKRELESLKELIVKHLGPPAKEAGKEVSLPEEIQEIVNSIGGLRKGQSFHYQQEGTRVVFAALWPWESNPEKITLKSGELEG